jgi:hypothetical protein
MTQLNVVLLNLAPLDGIDNCEGNPTLTLLFQDHVKDLT